MAYNLTAILNLNDRNFSKGMRHANSAMGTLRNGAGELTAQLGLMVGAAGAVGAAFSSITKAMDFEAQLSSIKALTGATGAEMAQMQKLALDMGSSTKYSALEAAQGIEELLKAGLTPATVKAGGLEAALNLATAGGLDLAKSAEIMSTALNAYKADAMTAAQASDILAGTANASATSVEELQYGLSAVSAVASGVGMSFKDTNIALGLFANNGLKGSDAGTSLKTMIANLSPMTDGAATQMEKLGLMTEKGTSAFYDAQGNVKSMAEIAGLLQTSLKDLNGEQRQQALYTMFGADAIRAANILYKEGTKGVQEFSKEMSKVTALDVAKEKMNNAAGAVEQFKGALETLQISVLTPLLPVIKDGANALADWISNLKPEQIAQWGENIKNAGQTVLEFASFIHEHWGPIRETIIGITVAVVSFKAAMIGLAIVSKITQMMENYRKTVTTATTAQAFFNGVLLANPIGLVVAGIAGLIAAGVLLYRNWDTVSKQMSKAWDVIKGAAEKSINFIIGGINDMIELINKIPGVNIPIVPKVDWSQADTRPPKLAYESTKLKPVQPNVPKIELTGVNMSKGRSLAGGLSNVPYNGYSTTLHKGERVLTPEENRAYKRGLGGVTIAKLADHIIVREYADIDKIAAKLAIKIQEARELGA